MAYGTLAGWRAYALARGDAAPTYTNDTDAGAALTRAADYIRWTYVERFSTGCTLPDATIAEAEYIAASAELAEAGFWTKTYTPSQQKVLTKVGDLAWTPVDGKVLDEADRARPISTAIEAILGKCLPSVRPGLFIKAIG